MRGMEGQEATEPGGCRRPVCRTPGAQPLGRCTLLASAPQTFRASWSDRRLTSFHWFLSIPVLQMGLIAVFSEADWIAGRHAGHRALPE